MKYRATFRLMATMTIWFYSTAFTCAGQIISKQDRNWAKETLQKEKMLETTPNPNSIAILPFKNKTGKEKLTPLEKGLTALLINDLTKVDQIQPIERVKIQALLDEMAPFTLNSTSAKTTGRIGRMLGSYYVVSGDIFEGKIKDLDINPLLLDVPFGTERGLQAVSGSMGDLITLEKDLLFDVLEQMKIHVSPAKKAELKQPVSPNTSALLALFLGIDHADKGEYVDAASMFEQALLEDSNLKMAEDCLQELKEMGLIHSMETAAVEEPPVIPPGAESKSTSVGKVVGIGLAAAVAGGAVLAIAGGGSGGDDSTVASDPVTPDDTDQTDNTSPTVASVSPVEQTSLNCEEGEIAFSFSETMSETGQATLSPADFAGNQGWANQSYVISWTHTSDYCQNLNQVNLSLNGFQDAATNPLTGKNTYTWAVE